MITIFLSVILKESYNYLGIKLQDTTLKVSDFNDLLFIIVIFLILIVNLIIIKTYSSKLANNLKYVKCIIYIIPISNLIYEDSVVKKVKAFSKKFKFE